jgi:hypothetical protein
MDEESLHKAGKALQRLILRFKADPFAHEVAYFSLFTLGENIECLREFVDVDNFTLPDLSIIEGMAQADVIIDSLAMDIDKNVIKTTADYKGDWSPIILLFSNNLLLCQEILLQKSYWRKMRVGKVLPLYIKNRTFENSTINPSVSFVEWNIDDKEFPQILNLGCLIPHAQAVGESGIEILQMIVI